MEYEKLDDVRFEEKPGLQFPYLTNDETSNFPATSTLPYETGRCSSPTTEVSVNSCDSLKRILSQDEKIADGPLTTVVNDSSTSYDQPSNSNSTPVCDSMCLSIVSVLFCTILGIISVRMTRASRRARDQGKIDEAKEKATIANALAIIAIVCGILVTIALIIHNF